MSTSKGPLPFTLTAAEGSSELHEGHVVLSTGGSWQAALSLVAPATATLEEAPTVGKPEELTSRGGVTLRIVARWKLQVQWAERPASAATPLRVLPTAKTTDTFEIVAAIPGEPASATKQAKGRPRIATSTDKLSFALTSPYRSGSVEVHARRDGDTGDLSLIGAVVLVPARQLFLLKMFYFALFAFSAATGVYTVASPSTTFAQLLEDKQILLLAPLAAGILSLSSVASTNPSLADLHRTIWAVPTRVPLPFRPPWQGLFAFATLLSAATAIFVMVTVVRNETTFAVPVPGGVIERVGGWKFAWTESDLQAKRAAWKSLGLVERRGPFELTLACPTPSDLEASRPEGSSVALQLAPDGQTQDVGCRYTIEPASMAERDLLPLSLKQETLIQGKRVPRGEAQLVALPATHVQHASLRCGDRPPISLWKDSMSASHSPGGAPREPAKPWDRLLFVGPVCSDTVGLGVDTGPGPFALPLSLELVRAWPNLELFVDGRKAFARCNDVAMTLVRPPAGPFVRASTASCQTTAVDALPVLALESTVAEGAEATDAAVTFDVRFPGEPQPAVSLRMARALVAPIGGAEPASTMPSVVRFVPVPASLRLMGLVVQSHPAPTGCGGGAAAGACWQCSASAIIPGLLPTALPICVGAKPHAPGATPRADWMTFGIGRASPPPPDAAGTAPGPSNGTVAHDLVLACPALPSLFTDLAVEPSAWEAIALPAGRGPFACPAATVGSLVTIEAPGRFHIEGKPTDAVLACGEARDGLRVDVCFRARANEPWKRTRLRAQEGRLSPCSRVSTPGQATAAPC